MKVNIAGLELIKHAEGLKTHAYKDQKGVWTIGYGHTLGVHPDDEITEEHATELLELDLAYAESVVNKYVHVNLTNNQFSALVSFVFNLGPSAFINSTLRNLLNQGDFIHAANQFPLWDKIRINGVLTPSRGLMVRRQAERTLFVKSDE